MVFRSHSGDPENVRPATELADDLLLIPFTSNAGEIPCFSSLQEKSFEAEQRIPGTLKLSFSGGSA